MQRVGRSGRKREGYVHVLLAERREEKNWNKAREAYNQVQRSIVRGDQLELYTDVGAHAVTTDQSYCQNPYANRPYIL